MTIGLDFDGTYAAAPDAWREVVEVLRKHGHTVVMVTARAPENHEEVDALVGDLLPVVYAGNTAGKRIASAAAGYAVDVWVDDNPQWIV